MRDILGIDALCLVLKDVSWHSFPIVRRLHWLESEDVSTEHDVELTLETDLPVRNCQITVLFKGVRDFKVQDLAARPSRISGFDVREISADHWEDIRWQITDYEDESVGFLCRDIRLQSARLV